MYLKLRFWKTRRRVNSRSIGSLFFFTGEGICASGDWVVVVVIDTVVVVGFVGW
jgi:hypothetical protein